MQSLGLDTPAGCMLTPSTNCWPGAHVDRQVPHGVVCGSLRLFQVPAAQSMHVMSLVRLHTAWGVT